MGDKQFDEFAALRKLLERQHRGDSVTALLNIGAPDSVFVKTKLSDKGLAALAEMEGDKITLNSRQDVPLNTEYPSGSPESVIKNALITRIEYELSENSEAAQRPMLLKHWMETLLDTARFGAMVDEYKAHINDPNSKGDKKRVHDIVDGRGHNIVGLTRADMEDVKHLPPTTGATRGGYMEYQKAAPLLLPPNVREK